MNGFRAGSVELFHLEEDLFALGRVAPEQPGAAPADLVSDLGIARAVIMHERNFGGHPEFERAIYFACGDSRSAKPIDGARQAGHALEASNQMVCTPHRVGVHWKIDQWAHCEHSLYTVALTRNKCRALVRQ